MPITVKDIAPKLASCVEKYLDDQRVQLSLSHLSSTPIHKIIREERKANIGFRNTRDGSGAIAGLLSFVGSYAMGLTDIFPFIVGGVLGSGVAMAFHFAYLPRVRAHYAAQLLRQALQDRVQTRTEKAYVEMLPDIAKLPLSERAALLEPINTLLDTHITLAEWERDLATVQTTPQNLEQERITLVQKARATNDTASREAFLKSAELISERLAVLPQMAAIATRIGAQQELIYQTLLSQQMALKRGRVTTQSLQTPDVSSLQQTATQLHQQSKAVEDALQELRYLG